MATWADRINNGTRQAPTSSPTGTFANKYSPQVSQSLAPTWATRINAGATVRSNPLNISNPQPPTTKGKVGDLFKDPKTQVMWEFTNSGWKVKPLAGDQYNKGSLVDGKSVIAEVEKQKQEAIKAQTPKAGSKVSKVIEEVKKTLGKKWDEFVKYQMDETAVGALLKGDVKGAGEKAKKNLEDLNTKLKSSVPTREQQLAYQQQSIGDKFKDTLRKAKNPTEGEKASQDLVMNFTPYGAATTKISKAIAQEVKPEVIKGFLKTAFKDIGDDVADALSTQLAGIKSPKLVEQTLNFFTKVERKALSGKALSTSSDEILKARQESLVKPVQESVQTTAQTVNSPTVNQPKKTLEIGDNINDFNKARTTVGESIVEDVKKGFEAGRKAREEAEKATSQTIGSKLRSETVDRLTPVFDFTKIAGKELPGEANPYKRMRLIAGVAGKTESYMMDNIEPILKSQKNQLDDLSVLWTLEREKELVGRGLTRKRNLEQIEQGFEELKAMKGKDYEALQKSTQDLRKVGDDTLKALHEAGIISDESFKAIKENNQFYAPMEAVEHIADNLEKGNYGSNNSFNVATQDVIKKIGDYSGDVADPIEAFVRQIPKAQALIEKNGAIKSLVNLRNEFPEAYKDLIIPLKSGNAPKGMGIVNVFEDGKNVAYGVPEAVADAVKNLDAESAGLLVKLGSWQAKLLRAGATGLNVAFIPVNIVRDIQDALTTELSENGALAMVKFLASYPQAIASAAGKGKLWRQWAASGGLSSTMTEQIFKNPTKGVNELAGKKNLVMELLKSPKSLIEFANRVGEQSTRLARFKSGIARGESATEAAFKSRDISLDFAKAGNKIKVLNQVIPFLNAGIQGSEKLMRLYKTNPVSALASTGLMFGVPTVALYNYNSQFKDFDDIPNSERMDNWIIIARDRTEEEKAAGEKIHGIKIPKGFLGRMVANTLDSSMDFMRKKDPEAFGKAILDSVAGISPVGVPYNKEKLGQSLAGITPPWIQAGIEYTTNTNLYYNQPIVPKKLEGVEPKEQYKETTPKVYKLAAEILAKGGINISPLMLENTVNTTTGGLGAQTANILSGDIEKGTTGAITRRFSGVRSGEGVNTEFDEVEKFVQDSKTESLKKKREAESIWSEIKDQPKDQMVKRLAEIKKSDPILLNKVKDTIEEEKLGLTSLERFVKTLPVEDGARARYLHQSYKKLKTPEERKAFLVNVIKKKIATKNVLKQFVYLNTKKD